jgi:hypothetical protein
MDKFHKGGKSGMKSINCTVYFDPLGDFNEERKLLQQCWKVWRLKHPDFTGYVEWKITDDHLELLRLIRFADIVFFDYGGLCLPGHEGMGLSFARELEKTVDQNPSKEFILLCTLLKCYYEDHYEQEYANLHFEEVLWHDLFDKYIYTPADGGGYSPKEMRE